MVMKSNTRTTLFSRTSSPRNNSSLGLNISPYQIRHGAASFDAVEAKRPLNEIQMRLRHTTDSTTKRYAKRVRYISEVSRTTRPS